MQTYRIGNYTVNHVMIIGRVAAEPKVRTLPSGAKIGVLRIATDHFYKKNGELQRVIDYHNVVTFSDQDVQRIQTLQTGDLVYISGRLRTRSWEDKQGQTRYSTEVVADRVHALATKAKQPPEKPEVTPSEVTPVAQDELDFIL